jgi:peptidoglycan/LPS O-acetylase OafA/YrhL
MRDNDREPATRDPTRRSAGIAVALVVIHHWVPGLQLLGLGVIGVQLFFVLSGFLITGVLLTFRSALEGGRATLSGILSSFWKSRAARILPVAFLALTVAFAVADRVGIQESLAWHFLFASNLLFFQQGAFESWFSHFWSLAVEQQFYVLWPLLVLRAPRRWLEPAILGLVVLAPVARFGLFAAGFEPVRTVQRPSVFELRLARPRCAGRCVETAAAAGSERAAQGPGMAGDRHLTGDRGWTVRRDAFLILVQQTFLSISFACIVAAAGERMSGLLGRTLECRPLVGLGIISYGVYVYHPFAPSVVKAALLALEAPDYLASGAALFALCTALTLLVAVLSWFLMERPIIEARRNRRERELARLLARPG